MDLTPIRVRGARPSRKRKGAEEFARSLQPRKRPVKTLQPQSAETNLLHNKDARRRLARIEQLPNELIQNIFTYCDNINLALSSPFIAQQLSDEKLFYQCALRLLYCPGSSISHMDCTCSSRPSPDDLYALLQRRWMSWSMFRKVILGVHELAVQDDQTNLLDLIFGTSVPVTAGDQARRWNTDDRVELRPDFVRPAEQPPLIYSHLYWAVQRPEMPEKLLRGPWSADNVSFLYYLIWLHLGIDWNHSTLGEVATSGLSRAIADGQRKVVASLTSPGLGVQPTMDMLRLAVVQHGCDKTIVFHLVCAAVRSVIESRGQQRSNFSSTDVNFRDPSMWSFAGRAPSDTGRWLRDLLRAAADIASARGHFDRDVFEELRTVCGRESDGVEQIEIPILAGE